MSSTSSHRRIDDRRHTAPELRFEPRADRDQHADRVGAQTSCRPQAQQPVLTVQTGQTTDAMYMGFYSDVLPEQQRHRLSLLRVVKPKLDSIERRADPPKFSAGGSSRCARGSIRRALAAHSVTRAGRLHRARQQQLSGDARHDERANGQRRPERGHGPAFSRRLQAAGRQAEERRDRPAGGCRERGAGRATVTTSTSRSAASAPVFIGIKVAPEANILDVAKRVRAAFPAAAEPVSDGHDGRTSSMTQPTS